MSAEHIESTEETGAAWWPMIGVHAGLLTVAFSAIFTLQPPGWFAVPEYVGFGLIGLALVLFAAVRRGRGIGLVGSGLLALGAGTALWLSWDPQLADLPAVTGTIAGHLTTLEASLAHVGVLLAVAFLAVQMRVDRRGLPRVVPFGGATIAAALLVVTLGVIMWLALRGLYDLTGTSGVALLAFRTAAFTLLMLVCATVSGVRGVGIWAHLYLGLILLGAVARNLMMG